MKRLILSACLLAPGAVCQDPLPQNVLKLAPASTIKAKSGETVLVALSAQVDPGFHVNSNTPADSYLIPLRLTWAPGPLESPTVTFPKPRKERYPFSTKPVSVFTGSFEIATRFKVAPGATPGAGVITGKLHYQACNDRTCLTPKTVEVTVPVEILK
jgi:thiol:disulfide interchange protein DsbD